MDFDYVEAVLAFLGLGSIVAGVFAERLKERVLGKTRATERLGWPPQ